MDDFAVKIGSPAEAKLFSSIPGICSTQRYDTRFTEHVIPPEANLLNLREICLKKAHIQSNVFYVTARSLSDAFFDTKNASETNAINDTPRYIAELGECASSRATGFI